MKKLLLILAFVLILAGVAWFFWPKQTGVVLVPGSGNATSSPFGSGNTVGVPAEQPVAQGESGAPQPTTEESSGQASITAKLFKISTAPVAGFIALAQSSTTVVRFVDRGTGNIFDAMLPAGDGGVLAKTRVTNQTLPQIYEAWFAPTGQVALFRTLDDSDVVKNVAVTINKPAASSSDAFSKLSMTSLIGSIDSLSAAGTSLYYEALDSGALLSSDFNGQKVKTWWNSRFPSWRTSRLGANMLIFTKPSATMPGAAYSLTSSGALTKLAGPLNGLDALGNASGSYFLYSYNDGGNTRLFASATKGTLTEIIPATFADKCVWSAQAKQIFFCAAPSNGIGGNEPDSWYQGKTHFSDDLWRFDASTGQATVLTQPNKEFGVNLDVSNSALSPDESYMIFMNKTDLSLWALRLR